jgi:PAS domain S-box-containing protein
MEKTMGQHRTLKNHSGMEEKFSHLNTLGKNCNPIKSYGVWQLLLISLFTSSVIISFSLLTRLLCPGISPGYYEMTIILSGCLAVILVASLILNKYQLYKYQSLLEKLEYRLGIKADNLDKVIQQFKAEREAHRDYARDLRVAEERYRSLVENVSEGILLLDTRGNFLEANQKMESLLGRCEAELLTMNLAQVFMLASPEGSRPTLRVVQKGEPNLANGWIVRKDGQRVAVHFAASKVEHRGKTVIQGIVREVTELRKPEDIQAVSRH